MLLGVGLVAAVAKEERIVVVRLGILRSRRKRALIVQLRLVEHSAQLEQHRKVVVSFPVLRPEPDSLPAGAAKTASTQMTQEGTPVRYLRSTFAPQEEKCFCLFEGESEEVVKTVQERAGLPYDWIVEARFITADEV